MRVFDGILDDPLSASILDTLDALVVLLDPRGVVLVFNHACERTTGYRASEIIGRPVWERLIPEEELAATREVFGSLVADQLPNRHTNHWLTKSGGRRWISWANSALVDDEGALRLVVATGTDLTESATLASALRRSDIELRSVLDSLPEAVIIHRRGELLFVNAACVRLLGYEHHDELVGGSILPLIHPDDLGLVLRRIRLGEEQGQPLAPVEERFLRRDGSVVYVEVVNRPVVFGGAPAMLATGRTTGERRRLFNRAAQMEQLAVAGTLAAGVGQELKPPLTSLRDSLLELRRRLESLAEGSREGERPRALSALRALVDESLIGAERVSGVASYLQQLATRRPSAPRPVNLRGALDQALTLVRNELRQRAHVSVRVGADVHVRCDDARLVQVLVNLLINAAHSIEPGDADRQRVEISAVPHEHTVLLTIRDTGEGMKPLRQARAFEPFYTTKAVGLGTGLGLPLSRQYIRELGGEITLESKVGVGTTVRVTLPTTTTPAGDPSHLKTPNPLSGRARVLIIDDEPQVARAIGRLLTLFYVVEILTDALSARRRLERGARYDVVLCDLSMPEAAGLALFADVASSDPAQAARFVFMTGGTYSAEVARFTARHKNRCLDKPVSPTALLATVAVIGAEPLESS